LIIAEFIPMVVEFTRLSQHVLPLGVSAEWRDQGSGLSIFLRGAAIGKLQVIDARFVRKKFRLVAARFFALGSRCLAPSIERRARGARTVTTEHEKGPTVARATASRCGQLK
jgi:hypothetical protein